VPGFDVGLRNMQAKRFRYLALLSVLPVICALGILAWVTMRMTSVPGGEFQETLIHEIENRGLRIVEEVSGMSSPDLPVLLRIRFPRSSSKGSLGFPDAAAVYTIESEEGLFRCVVRHRRHQACYVEISEGSEGTGLASELGTKFPGLSITTAATP